MVKLIERLQYNVNLKKLKEYLIAIEKNIFYPKLNGISIQHRKNVPAPWNLIDGLESLKIYEDCTEKDFNVVHKNFKNTTQTKLDQLDYSDEEEDNKSSDNWSDTEVCYGDKSE